MLWASSALGACVTFSPFETDLEAGERDQIEQQLVRLEAQEVREGAFRFAIISDSHSSFDTLARVVSAINRRDDIAFVAHLGDMTEVGLREEFVRTVRELKRLDVPFVTAIGNHDTLSYGLLLYGQMFGALDYTFRYGSTRFVSVNSNTREFPQGAVPDLTFLTEATRIEREDGVTGVIVLSHQTLKRRMHVEVLAAQGVLAAFSGHTHRFAVDRVEGVLMGVVGTTKDHAWLLVEVDGREVSISECDTNVCALREPPR